MITIIVKASLELYFYFVFARILSTADAGKFPA
jgi:hypothetical protein